MIGIIKSIDLFNNSFMINHRGKNLYFYLNKHIFQIFENSLDKGLLVSFETSKKTIINKNIRHCEVTGFNYITSLYPRRIYYNFSLFRNVFLKNLQSNKYYLFLDYEMTMYNNSSHGEQIINFGAVVTTNKNEEVTSKSYYVRPSNPKYLNKRTRDFINVDKKTFFDNSKSFTYFYHDLKDLYEKYNPKIVVWGSFDIYTFNKQCIEFRLKNFTTKDDYLDLSVILKGYFNLSYHPGLINTYNYFSRKSTPKKQIHDAFDDSVMTRAIFFKFCKTLKIKGLKNGF